MDILTQEVALLNTTRESAIAEMEKMEAAGRICYKSGGSIQDGSYTKFLEGLVRRGHLSVIEHTNASFWIQTSRGIANQIVRHRIASYSQECLAGDTLITERLTLRDLYNKGGVVPTATSMREDKKIVPNQIEKVLYKGFGATYLMKTSSGNEIRATSNHRFMTVTGFKRLEKLNTGDFIYVKDGGSNSAVLTEITELVYAGMEKVYDLTMAAPLHNYLANGFVVHNSTRYCNYASGRFGNAISVIAPTYLTEEKSEERYVWLKAMRAAQASYLELIEKGVPPEVARGVLPHDLKTELVMTANLREWRHFIKLRGDKASHPDIQELAHAILEELVVYYPPIFKDLLQEGS